MRIIVLLSCMHQKDASIVRKNNIQTDAVVVNQCDEDKIEEFDFTNINGKLCHVKVVYTRERGLSRSRNMAIQHAWGDICYICDDDVVLEDDFERKIISAYASNPEYNLLTFAVKRKNYKYPGYTMKMGVKQILRTSSVQTTFKRKNILKNSLAFDVKMGSGSGNGGGEENKFLMDCRKKGIKMLYIPEIIATVQSEDSMWFKGFNEKYFKDTFWAARRTLGAFVAFFYIFYWCLFRSKCYEISLTKFQMLKYAFIGYFEKR